MPVVGTSMEPRNDASNQSLCYEQICSMARVRVTQNLALKPWRPECTEGTSRQAAPGQEGGKVGGPQEAHAVNLTMRGVCV